MRPSKSVIWSFNRSYWRHLAAWDATFQKDYASALPGGVSDGTNPGFWEDQISCFIRTLDRLDEWSDLPDEIHVLELGVGDGQQAKVWLDAFAKACAPAAATTCAECATSWPTTHRMCFRSRASA